MPKMEDTNQVVASEDNMVRVEEEIGKDEALQAMKATFQRGWPESKNRLPARVTHYSTFETSEWCKKVGDRVVIPNALRRENNFPRSTPSAPRNRVNAKESTKKRLLAQYEQ